MQNENGPSVEKMFEEVAMQGVGSGDGLAELKRELADAVREYEVALMRNPMDEEEIRRAVDKCVNARKQFNAANTGDDRRGVSHVRSGPSLGS
jgi:hypothetical protein